MRENTKSRLCLLLNADYTPLRIISWKRAIIWSIKYENCPSYNIEVIHYHPNQYINGTNNRQFKIPSVAKTVSYFNIYDKNISFSRKNLFIRDNCTCQYCGNNFSPNQLTYDHIIPKSRFNKDRKTSTNWFNIVTACRKCNAKKGNRTPVEANMTLIKEPSAPKYSMDYLPWVHDASIMEYINKCEQWRPFLERFYESKFC